MIPETGFPITPEYGTIAGHTVMRLMVPESCGLLAYQQRMLEGQAVPGLLPMTCERQAGVLLLTWRVSGCQSLAGLFERRPLGVSEMMRLIRPLPDLFERMESLLLDVGRLEFDSRFIQHDPVSGALRFAYRPLSSLPVPDNCVREALRQWFLEACRPAGPSDARLLSDMLHLLDNPAFHWECLRNLFAKQVSELVHTSGSDAPEVVRREAAKPVPEPGNKASPYTRHAGVRHENTEKGTRHDGMRHVDAGKGTRHDGIRHVDTGNDMSGDHAPNRTSQPGQPRPPHLRNSAARPADSSRARRVAKAVALQVALLILALCAWSAGVLSLRGPDGDMARAGLLVTGLAIELLAVLGLRGREADGAVADAADAAAVAASGALAPVPARPSAGLRIPAGILPRAAADMAPAWSLESVSHMAADVPMIRPADTDSPEQPVMPPAQAVEAEQAAGGSALLEFERQVETEGTGAGGALPAMYRSPYVVGRLRAQVDGCLTRPAVGKVHAEVRKTATGFAVCDLNSRNGTRVNGLRLEPYRPHAVGEGDRISFADESFLIRLQDGIPKT